MSFAQTYYLDIDSNYRDTSVYPNATDFTLPFKTNTSTGFFAQGEPLNPQSYFESVSIDPNVSNANISITNGTISNIKIIETQAFVSGVLDPGNTIFKYKNTQIFSLTGLNNSSAFLARFDISSLGTIPYIFNWCVYSDSKTGTTNTTRTTFTFDLLNNIYMEFDAVGYTIDVYYVSSVSFPLNYYTLEGFNNINHSIFILYLTVNGNKGTYQNHDWGYHRINDQTYDLVSVLDNGKFNLNVDSGNNIITSFNISLNPKFKSTDIIYQWSVITQLNLWNWTTSPISISEYFNNNGTGYIMTNINSQFLRLFPFLTMTTTTSICLNTVTGAPLVNNIPLYNYFMVSQPVCNFPVSYSGTLYSFISYCDYFNVGNVFPINVMRYSDDGTSGYYIASTSGSFLNSSGYYEGGVDSTFYIWCETVNDNIYICTRPGINRCMEVYKYNPPTNAMLKVASSYCTGTITPLANIVSYQMSGYIYCIAMEMTSISSGNLTTPPAFIFKFNPSTNNLEFLSKFNLLYDSNCSTVIDVKDSGNAYMFTSYASFPNISVIDLTDPYNPNLLQTITAIVSQNTLFLYEYTLNNGNKRKILLTKVSSQIYDVTDISNIKFFYNIVNPSTESIYIDSFGYVCSLSTIGFYNPQFINKSPFFNDINIESTHYNINNQLTIELNSYFDKMEKFNINTNSYFTICNINKFIIYKTDSIVNTYEVSNFNINLTGSTGTVFNLKPYYLNNSVYILIIFNNNSYIYKSDISNEESSSPLFNGFSLFYNTTGNNIIDSSLGYSSNSLLMTLVQDFQFSIYKYNGIFNQIFNYIETDLNYPLKFTTFFYYPTFNTYYLTVSNLYLVNILLSQTKFYNMNDLNNITLYSSVTERSVFLKNTFNIISNITYQTYAITNSNSICVTQINNNLTGTQQYEAIFLINSFRRVFDTIENNGLLNVIYTKESSTGVDGIYIVQGEPTNRTILTSNQILLNGIANGINLFKTSTQYYFISLLNTNKLYIYDITNLNFAVNNQNLTKNTSTSIYDTTYSAGIIQRILQNGDVDYTNLIGGSIYDEIISQNVNISNIDITDDYKNVVVCGAWTESVSFYYKTSTGSTYKSNLLTYNIDTSNNSYILNTSIDGINKYVIPLEGPVSNIIQRLQLNGNDTAEFVGYSSSSSFYIYNKQDAGNYVDPTVIQKVFNIISDTNAFYISINITNGTLQRDLIVFTNDQSRSIRLYDLNIGPDYTVLVGTSNANTLRIVNNSVPVEQVLYSYIDYNNSENLFFITLETESGAFIGTNLVDVSTNITIDIQDIKQDPEFNRAFIVPRFNLTSGTGTITIYNSDGSVALYNYFNGGGSTTPYSLLIQYLYIPLFLDKNGEYYSYIVYRNPPPLYDFEEDFSNYNLFLIGNQNDTYLNRNYSVRYNFIEDGLYKIILNQTIDIGSVIKLLTEVNGITGSQYGYTMNLTKSPQDGYIIYNLNTVPNNENKIISTNIIGYVDTEQFYYFMIPFQSSTGPINKLVPITNININTGGNYEFTVGNINDLRISLPSGSFYGPYIPFVKPNNKIYSVIPFFGSSIFTPIYYNITLDSITLPNRPIKSLALPGSRSWNDIPFFYVSIYPVDDFGDYDPETVNVVYTNTKLLVLPNPIFKIQIYETSETANFVTFSSITTPVIKFDKNYTNLAIRILDSNGDVLLFDVSPTKETDLDFPDDTLPDSFTNIYLRITLTKR